MREEQHPRVKKGEKPAPKGRWENAISEKASGQCSKGDSCFIKGVCTIWLCVSRSYPRKSTPREEGKLGSNRTVKFSKGSRHHIKNRVVQKCEPHERSPCAPKFGETSREETLHQERCARTAAWDLHKTTFYIPGEAKAMSTPIASKRPEERQLVVDSGASMHMMSKKKN